MLEVLVSGEGSYWVESNIANSEISLKGTTWDTTREIFRLVLLWGTNSSWNLGYLREFLAQLLVSLCFGGSRVQNTNWLIVNSPIRSKEPYNIWRI